VHEMVAPFPVSRSARFDPPNESRQSSLGRGSHPGELLTLGIEVSQAAAARYMVRNRTPP